MSCCDSKQSSPPKATHASQPVASCSKCCCCVTSVSIGNKRDLGPTLVFLGGGWVANGHAFDFTIQMSFCTGTSGSSDCKLEWWEKVNAMGIPGAPTNTWTDMYAGFSTSPTFEPWNTRTVPCPDGGSRTVVIVDVPGLGVQPGVTVTRTLEFRLVVKSGSGCACGLTSATATAKQVLTMVNGTLVAASFDIGPSSTTR
jgi:hypothetical protein